MRDVEVAQLVLFKEVVGKKELEEHTLEIQQRFLHHQTEASQRSIKPQKLKSEKIKFHTRKITLKTKRSDFERKDKEFGEVKELRAC